MAASPRRRRRGQPHNPAHDRRAESSNRGVESYLTPKEVDDPYEAGGKIIVMRSTRDDPLADLHARNMIDEAQYHAGRAFQRDFEAAEGGVRAIDFTREAVDGGTMPDPLSEARMRAGKQLAIVYAALGHTGQVVVHEVLVHSMTRKQMAESRGLSGKRWEEFYGMRFRECLDCLAIVYGFSMEKR